MNLNIEGTKHEKAVLVILSYVVGFTAGFIVFGVTSTAGFSKNSPLSSEPAEVPASVTEANVAAPAPEVIPATETTENNTNEQVMYKEGRLMANVNGASVLLSAQLATVDAETAKTFATQGVHEAIPKYLASPDGAFIYYCEQHSTADSCMNFVYDVNNQIIHYVTVGDIKLVTPAAMAESAIWQDRTLSIGSAISVSSDTPWKLIKI